MSRLRTLGHRLLRLLMALALGVPLAVATAWGCLALYYSDLQSPLLRQLLAGAFVFWGLLATGFVMLGRRRRGVLLAFGMLFMALITWWEAIPASNTRDWQTDVARLAYADIDGERITVHNIRNFDYRSETDYTPAYYDKTYDLGKLRSVDLFAVYWMGPAIAHTFLSFGFEGGNQLAVSIETRKEKSEQYSTIKGFFKQYELYYVVADERDVVRLRTNYRKDPPEEVYVYRVHGPVENARRVFMQYMHKINGLKQSPEFYNTLIDNCTTGIWMNTRINPKHLPLSWKVLASGYLPQYLYQSGRLDASLPFAELQRLGHVNLRAQAAGQDADFSRLIRVGVPGMISGQVAEH